MMRMRFGFAKLWHSVHGQMVKPLEKVKTQPGLSVSDKKVLKKAKILSA